VVYFVHARHRSKTRRAGAQNGSIGPSLRAHRNLVLITAAPIDTIHRHLAERILHGTAAGPTVTAGALRATCPSPMEIRFRSPDDGVHVQFDATITFTVLDGGRTRAVVNITGPVERVTITGPVERNNASGAHSPYSVQDFADAVLGAFRAADRTVRVQSI
jgi:hypothetical protein